MLCLAQISYSAIINLAKIVFYQGKIIKAQELQAQAEARNARLKNEIKNFSSMYKVESIARNNLKMAAKDEVLIIINQPAEETKKYNETFDKQFVKFFEDFALKFDKDLSMEKSVE